MLLDLTLPDSQGLDTFGRTHKYAPGVLVVILTGFYDEDVAAEAVRQGAQDYLFKGQMDGLLSPFYARNGWGWGGARSWDIHDLRGRPPPLNQETAPNPVVVFGYVRASEKWVVECPPVSRGGWRTVLIHSVAAYRPPGRAFERLS